MLSCPKCSADMVAGFLVDRSYGEYATIPEWVEGVPERSFWTGLEYRGRERSAVTTFRCVQCGYLESYTRSRQPPAK